MTLTKDSIVCLTQTVPCLETNTHARILLIATWSWCYFRTVTIMLKFLVVRTIGFLQHVPSKLYLSIFLCMLSFLQLANGMFVLNGIPICKETLVFQNFCNFSYQIEAASSFVFLNQVSYHITSQHSFQRNFQQNAFSIAWHNKFEFNKHSIFFPK